MESEWPTSADATGAKYGPWPHVEISAVHQGSMAYVSETGSFFQSDLTVFTGVPGIGTLHWDHSGARAKIPAKGSGAVEVPQVLNASQICHQGVFLAGKSNATTVRNRIIPRMRGWALGFVGVALLSLTACSLRFHDRAATDQPAHVSATGSGCLEGTLQVVQDYPSGQDSVAQVNGAWTCAISALDSFANLATGQNASFYSANSIRTFLEQNFLGKTKISDTLLQEGMLLKQVLLGGSTDRLTHDEVIKVRDAFKKLQVETVALLPHIRILTLKEVPGSAPASSEKVEAALLQFAKSSVVIGSMLSQALVPYDLSHLGQLLTEIQGVYTAGSGWVGPQALIDNISVFYHVKALMVAPDGQVVAPSEWNPLFVRGSELYSIFLRIHYLMYTDELLSGPGLGQLHAAVEHGFETVHQAILSKEDHVITYELIDPVIDDFLNIGVVSWKVQNLTWKGLVRVAFEKVLNPPGGTTGLRPPRGGITESSLALARETAEGWLETQREWGMLVHHAAFEMPSIARDGSVPLTMVGELWPQIISKAPKQHEDLNQLFQRPYAIDYSAEGTVIFEPDRSKVWMNQAMFNSVNWKQSFIRAVVMGYSTAPELHRYQGLTRDEFHNFYLDGRALGVDLGLLDPSDENVWSSVFTELNIFVLSSDGGSGDGSKYVSFSEGVDFVSNALSSSVSAHLVYEDLLANCAHQSVDVFNIPRWTAECYRDRFKKSFSSVYRYFPAWVEMVKKLTPAEMNSFQQTFESAARKKGISNNLVESTDVDRGTMIMHYIESLYDRFDKDQSGTLNFAEAKQAFPLLRDLLAEAAKTQDNDELIALYAYLMKNGKAPTTFRERTYFWAVWQRFPSLWTFEADRQQLVKIVANLNQTAGH